jgi:hypothetical protein
MTLSEKLIKAGAGTWIFVGTFFPSILYVAAAISISTIYFFVDHVCSQQTDIILYVGIGLAHLFPLMHGFLLAHPLSLKWAVTGFVTHYVLVIAYVALSLLSYFSDTPSSTCTESVYFYSVLALFLTHCLYILAFTTATILLFCSLAPCCGCLRVDDGSEPVADSSGVSSHPSRRGRRRGQGAAKGEDNVPLMRAGRDRSPSGEAEAEEEEEDGEDNDAGTEGGTGAASGATAGASGSVEMADMRARSRR